MRSQRLLVLALIIAVPIIVGILYAQHKGITFTSFTEPGVPVLRIGDIGVQVEVASTEAALQRGLSGKSGLPTGTGMLFVFPTNDTHGIWMKDMRFPIDIIWINEKHVIVDIAQNVQPDSYPQVFRPARAARYVLEVNARYTDTFNIEIGQTVTIPRRILSE